MTPSEARRIHAIAGGTIGLWELLIESQDLARQIRDFDEFERRVMNQREEAPV